MPCLNLIRERKIEENEDHASSLLILYVLTEMDSTASTAGQFSNVFADEPI